MADGNSDTCPTGCGRKVEAGKLMCRQCWSKVPRSLQAEVYTTWRAWRKDFGDLDAFENYENARENAIASIA